LGSPDSLASIPPGLRILDVSPMAVCPPRRGSAVRTYNLLRHLSRNHEVCQFSLVWDEHPVLRPTLEKTRVTPTYCELCYRHPVSDVANALGKRAWVNAPLLSGLALMLTRPKPLRCLLDWADVVLVEFPWQFGYCRRAHGRQRFVLASHNVESLKFPSWAAAAGASFTLPWVRYVERAEMSAARHADLILAVSPEERDHYVERYGVEPGRVIEVPNGADIERFAPVEPEARSAIRRRLGLPDRTTVLYAASSLPPNRLGADWVGRLAAKVDHLSFVAVGAGAQIDCAPANMRCTGYVDDVQPWFQAADIALCPIEHGAGTKIKLLEYMASGLPAVAFRAALHGLAARDGVEVVGVEPQLEAFQLAVEQLANDKALAWSMGVAARRLIEERYDWARIAARLDAALNTSVTPQTTRQY
jgi:glycosyltransferase involved in cell wall biosynthesis